MGRILFNPSLHFLLVVYWGFFYIRSSSYSRMMLWGLLEFSIRLSAEITGLAHDRFSFTGCQNRESLATRSNMSRGLTRAIAQGEQSFPRDFVSGSGD